jgi:RNA polymerase sigma factor (sigma-70 family)
LDKLIGEDWDCPSSEPSPEDIVMERFEIETLYKCLDRLDADERALIDALFFDGLTEQEYADLICVTQKTVNNRKHRILSKMKNYF